MKDITYLITLRLVHIVCGVFWAGAAMYLALFVMPAVNATGPEGGRFMQQLARTNKLPMVMTVASSLSVIAGLLLFWKISGGFQSAWMSSKHGIILSIGGALAIIAWLEGFFITRPNALKLNKLGQLIAKSAGPPDARQLNQISQYRQKIFSANNHSAVLLVASVITMSIVRYL